MRPTRLALLGFLLLALGALPRSAHAEDEMEAPPASRTMLLGPATILASPGTPRALDSFLPGGRRPQRLTWPLPDGPLVVLGLPHQDEVAQQVADAFQIDTDDLAGGYRFAAWRTKSRPVVIVMAADAAALAAARFEFDASAPMEMVAPDMRSLDFKRPNQEAGVAVQMGTRHIQPRYAYRAWAPYGTDDRRTLGIQDLGRAIGAHVNRLWFRLRDLRGAAGADLLARTRRHGIVPVLRVPVGDATIDRSRDGGMAYAGLIASISEAAFVKHGIRHFAFEFENDPRDLPRHKGSRAACEAALIETLAMEFAQAEELLLLPSAHADDLARRAGASLDAARLAGLRGIKPAVRARMRMGWSGPTSYAPEITASQARARSQAAGMPLILLDRWAQPFQDEATPYFATRPRGRDPQLADVLDGAVVFGQRGTDDTLYALWAPLEEDQNAALLRDALPPTPDSSSGADWLPRAEAGLRAADKANLQLVPWLGGLARELATGRALAGADRAGFTGHLGEVAADGIDGRLDDEVWKLISRPSLRTAEGVEITWFASHAGLTLGVRVPQPALAARSLLLRIALRRPGGPRGLEIELDESGWRIVGSLGTGHATARHAVAREAGGLQAELVLDRVLLGGDAHPGRAFEFAVSWGPLTLWPQGARFGERGVLFVRP